MHGRMGVGPGIILGLSGAVFCRIRGNITAVLDIKDLRGLVGFADFLVELVRERKGPKTSLGLKNEYVNVGDNTSEEGQSTHSDVEAGRRLS